jgi:hypothetical protein
MVRFSAPYIRLLTGTLDAETACAFLPVQMAISTKLDLSVAPTPLTRLTVSMIG